eukprot:18752-Eustigmatos_ZCMA.PRE.1
MDRTQQHVLLSVSPRQHARRWAKRWRWIPLEHSSATHDRHINAFSPSAVLPPTYRSRLCTELALYTYLKSGAFKRGDDCLRDPLDIDAIVTSAGRGHHARLDPPTTQHVEERL